MHIRKVSSLVVAETVINLLINNEHLPHNEAEGIYPPYIESYQNGREQGLTVAGLGNMMAIHVAEYRRSDNIVVYCGQMAHQGISDDAYANQKFFEPGEYEEAATYISELIVKHGFPKSPE